MIPKPGGNHLLLFVEKSLKKPENHLPGYRRSGHLPEKLAYQEAPDSASLPKKRLTELSTQRSFARQALAQPQYRGETGSSRFAARV